MNRSPPTPVLRNVAVDASNRVLLRRKSDVPMPQDATVAPHPLPPVEPVDLMQRQRRAQEEGHASGYQEGLQQGLAEAEKRIQAAIKELQRRNERDQESAAQQRTKVLQSMQARLEDVLTHLLATNEQHVAALEVQAVELAFGALCKIIGARQERATMLRGAIEQQLQTLRSGNHLKIRLAGEDLAQLRSDAPLMDALARHTAIEWVADTRLKPGACLVESGLGQVDIGLKTQLTRLREVWIDAALPSCDGHQPGAER